MPEIREYPNDWDGGDWSDLVDTADPNVEGWDAPILWVASLDELFEGGEEQPWSSD